MRNGFLLLAVVFALLLAAPAHAAKGPIIGIGDQKTEMFDDPRLDWLGIRHARLVVPWYVASGRNKIELAYVDRWLAAARRNGVTPLIGFGHGFVGWTRIWLPSAKQYSRAVRAFRKRYPWVRNYITWNEANHCSQPTCKKPARVGRYYDALKGQCPTCTVVAAAVIDQPNMVSWLRRFKRAARRKATLYGLHNYLDVNRLRSTGTRRLLRAEPKARIWITETGGLVRRKHTKGKADFPENARHAGRVMRYLLRLSRKLRRIERVYVYHWNVDRPDAHWDSGLIDPFGKARPGFDALVRHFGKNPATAPRKPAPPPSPSQPPPSLQQQPPSEPQGSTTTQAKDAPPPEQQSSQTAPSSTTDCSVADLCERPLGIGGF